MGEGTEDEFYEISAVSRLTGLSTHVLRVWERRYGVVDPGRTDTKRRQYNRSDIQRLTLLKSLVDNGHTISSVAKLDIEALEERLASVLKNEVKTDDRETCRIGLVAIQARRAVREASDSVETLSISAEFPSLEELVKNIKPGAIDLLIVEEGSLFAEGVAEIREAIGKLKVNRAIVIYQFAAEEVIAPGNIEKVTVLRGPVTAAEILLACSADAQLARKKKVPLEKSDNDSEIPAHLFTAEQLVTISKRASVVECECPQHISALLNGLSSFEEYSKQCESRSEDDAELHAFLYRETAVCRHTMEKALLKVLEAEGIEI